MTRPANGPKCQICRHPDRLRIEMARLSGASLDSIAAKFGVTRDAIWRHMAKHVDADRRAVLLADVPLKELAERAAAEGVSLLDYFAIVRAAVMGQLINAASMNDRNGTAVLAGRATEVLREIGKLTGEILKSAPVGNVTTNVLLFMATPAYANLERMLIRTLAPHPDALKAVLEGLKSLEGDDRDPPPTISGIALPTPEAANVRVS